METLKIRELKQKINMLKDEIIFINSAISVIMSEQNLLDMEIVQYTIRGQETQAKLRDLQAELKDTI